MIRTRLPVITRLRVQPNEVMEGSQAAVRARGTRSPHTEAKVAVVRRLIEQTTLSYSEIALRTGVGRASICRWTRDQKWQRPLFAPRATDTVPTIRAGQKLKLRLLAERLRAIAERAIRELEEQESVDLTKLAEALELLKLAKLAVIGRHGPRKRRRRLIDDAANNADAPQLFDAAPRELLRGLRAAGIDTLLAPEEAVMDFIASRTPIPKNLTRKQRREKYLRERR
ncbi:MAG: hypothetical protein EKK40_12390 [Bradyrhizobiaceae bacterium]|nr:MAG: hypothetical protein EKK40_12390 [Bradyrhizobiaceae bacterium]